MGVPSGWVGIKIRAPVASRILRLVRDFPELGFGSLSEFVTQASVREAERIEVQLATRTTPVLYSPPVRPSPEPVESPRPSPPPAPSPASQPSPGETSTEGPVGRTPRPKRGRSPRSTAAEAPEAEGPEAPGVPATPPDEAKPPVPPSAEAPAATIPTGSTWTCPDCHATMPLVERAWHRPDCPVKLTGAGERVIARGGGKGEGGDNRSPEDEQRAREPRERPKTSREEQGPSATTAPVPATAPRTHPKRDLLIARCKAFAGTAGKGQDPLARLAAVVQKAYTDGGHIEPSDEEARELVKSFAAQEPAIERALEKVAA